MYGTCTCEDSEVYGMRTISFHTCNCDKDKNIWNMINACNYPQPMKDILFVTNSGQIYKGFLNLADLWIIENSKQLSSGYCVLNDYILAWRELPDAADEGWKRQEEEKPEKGSYVLSKDWLSDEVYIAYVALPDRWIIRNMPDDKETFWESSDKNMWMPMPEPPELPCQM